VPVQGYYNIQCSATIDIASNSPLLINTITNKGFMNAQKYFILQANNNNISYSSSGFVVVYCNPGDTISLVNLNDNTSIIGNLGYCKINLL
jgi:hypothetical protein